MLMEGVVVVLHGMKERMYLRDPRKMIVFVDWMVVVVLVGIAVGQY